MVPCLGSTAGDSLFFVTVSIRQVIVRFLLVAAEAHRPLGNRLDDVEHGLAVLFTHRVAKDAAEQPDVVAQRQVLVVVIDDRGDRIDSSFLRSPMRADARSPCMNCALIRAATASAMPSRMATPKVPGSPAHEVTGIELLCSASLINGKKLAKTRSRPFPGPGKGL